MRPTRIRELKMKKSLFILVVVVFLGINVNAQTENESKFQLLIENTENGIKITSSKGCAFKELTFSLSEGQIQEIDQYGMRKANDEIRKVDDNFASFRMTIKKEKDVIYFEGIEGTVFSKLSFLCLVGKNQLINQNGML